MFSIIIPCQKPSDYLNQCLEHILSQDYADPNCKNGASFEIIVLPDEAINSWLQSFLSRAKPRDDWSPLRNKIKIIPTGQVLPGAKRNIGAKNAQGKILAFIDDDVYPAPDWLKNATKYFEDEKVIAIGGPGATPPDDSFWQQTSGAVYLSWFSGANPERFWPIYKKNNQVMDYKLQVTNYEINDWPSMNFFVRHDDFFQASGFDERFWPGEDTILCQKLIQSAKKIIYAPTVLVFHHRRKNLREHLKQAGQFGFMRGKFFFISAGSKLRLEPDCSSTQSMGSARTLLKIPNSLRLKYFLPAAFSLFILLGWLLLFLTRPFNLLYPALWLIYFFVTLVALIQIYSKIKKTRVTLATLVYIPLTHFWYGWKFLRGMFTKNL